MTPVATAGNIVASCRAVAACSEDADAITRRFLSPPMRQVHEQLGRRMRAAGMRVTVDAAGNLRGVYGAEAEASRRLLIGSHLDSVPNAGAFDGVLGVIVGIALVEGLQGRKLPFAIEVIGFSDEEGARFGVPFIGSRALVGAIDRELLATRDRDGKTVSDAIADFGLDPARLSEARNTADILGYLEFHIEQGPVLDRRQLPLAVVERIVGQTRYQIVFTGAANHAGTTPMADRRDAVAGAAAWIVAAEEEARAVPGLVATVGRVEVQPGATNVIAGRCLTTLDVRHPDDAIRRQAAARILDRARAIADSRRLQLECETLLDQAAVPMDPALTARLAAAVARAGHPVHHMASGAGHDAMIVAATMPTAMLFVRSPGGISHHPDESVREEDVAAALAAGTMFLEDLSRV